VEKRPWQRDWGGLKEYEGGVMRDYEWGGMRGGGVWVVAERPTYEGWSLEGAQKFVKGVGRQGQNICSHCGMLRGIEN